MVVGGCNAMLDAKSQFLGLFTSKGLKSQIFSFIILYLGRKTHDKYFEGFGGMKIVNVGPKGPKMTIRLNFCPACPSDNCLTVLRMAENFQPFQNLT